MSSLEAVLVLLAAAVLVVVAFRFVGLPPVLGYLMVGALIGPHALGVLPDTDQTRHLAEFGVVFLMFSIGLEFSLPKLFSMKRIVFGLGLAQVAVTSALFVAMALLAVASWRGALALGGAIAMSSTAVLSKMLVERMELESPHGRQVMGVLLFQDLAVVPFLVLIPALGQPADKLAMELGLAAVKAVVALSLILYFGPRLMRRWFGFVARRRSAELFMLNVLLITLGLAFATQLAGLSLALGAFLAGMLISETEYRYEVEEDIKPFRDVLMGLFFVTVGMLLDLALVVRELLWVLLALAGMLAIKFGVIVALSRAFGTAAGTALRVALWLCTGGEFGFVLMALIGAAGLVTDGTLQIVLAAMVLSMLLSPLLAQYADRIVLRLVPSEWLLRSMQLTSIAAQSMATERHAIVCGYGRNGQYLARFLDQEDIPYIALDLDPERVREAAAAGERVVFGDAGRRETLLAAGLARAALVVVTMADTRAAERVLHLVQELRREVPVVVRTATEDDIDRLSAAGAAEVVPEALESSIMLASHALALLGVPLSRVLRRVREIRGQRYHLLRGIYRGAAPELGEDSAQDLRRARLHSVALTSGAFAVGRSIAELGLKDLGVEVTALRRHRVRAPEPQPQTRFAGEDVVVLLGTPEQIAQAEERLLKG
ncbi:MAG: cation:proton antiporter [Betaproteobacteria bacterium]|nr:cation:proton antiporter [Betaproteobacteria bacterium]